MHPGDVLDYVVAEVAELERRIQAAPALGVTRVALEDDIVLYVHFRKQERPRIGATLQSGIVGPGGQAVSIRYEAVDLSRTSERELILMLECDDFDGHPPTAQLLQADRAPLPAGQWPTDLSRQGVIHGHRDYARPFFCRRGLREFHSHPQHQDEPWDLFREALPLHTIVLELLSDLRSRWVLW